MPKQKTRKAKTQRKNNDPLVKKPKGLGEDEDNNHLGGGIRFREPESGNDTEGGAQLVEPKSTWKILQEARKQQAEENPISEEYEENFPALSALTGRKNFEILK